jgi:hypothetical protein
MIEIGFWLAYLAKLKKLLHVLNKVDFSKLKARVIGEF